MGKPKCLRFRMGLRFTSMTGPRVSVTLMLPHGIYSGGQVSIRFCLTVLCNSFSPPAGGMIREGILGCVACYKYLFAAHLLTKRAIAHTAAEVL